MEKLKEILQKLPLKALLVAYLAFLAYDYYDFTTAPESELIRKEAELASVKKENDGLQGKLKAASDFYKSLEAKRADLRKLAESLNELRGTLNEELDVPGLMKMVVTEARRVGLNVTGVTPLPKVKREYYEEQPFSLSFKGVYVQLLVFLDRLSNVQNIVRVDDYELKPVGNNTSQFVELEGTVQVKAYKYVGTTADDIVKAGAAGTGGTAPASGGPAKPAATGTKGAGQ